MLCTEYIVRIEFLLFDLLRHEIDYAKYSVAQRTLKIMSSYKQQRRPTYTGVTLVNPHPQLSHGALRNQLCVFNSEFSQVFLTSCLWSVYLRSAEHPHLISHFYVKHCLLKVANGTPHHRLSDKHGL